MGYGGWGITIYMHASCRLLYPGYLPAVPGVLRLLYPGYLPAVPGVLCAVPGVLSCGTRGTPSPVVPDRTSPPPPAVF